MAKIALFLLPANFNLKKQQLPYFVLSCGNYFGLIHLLQRNRIPVVQECSTYLLSIVNDGLILSKPDRSLIIHYNRWRFIHFVYTKPAFFWSFRYQALPSCPYKYNLFNKSQSSLPLLSRFFKCKGILVCQNQQIHGSLGVVILKSRS